MIVGEGVSTRSAGGKDRGRQGRGVGGVGCAVVDARGAVHGIDRLFVADASVMPTIPSANTNLPTIVIAERIASWVDSVP